MAEVQDTHNFFLKNASSHDLVRAVLEKIKIIPIEVMNLNQKLPFVLCSPSRGNLTNHQIVDNMSIPRQLGKSSRMAEVLAESLNSSRDKWSATTFSTLFLSLMVRLNSYRRRIHLIKHALASLLEMRYLRAAWSVKTMIGEPNRFARNLSRAKTTASNSFSVVE